MFPQDEMKRREDDDRESVCDVDTKAVGAKAADGWAAAMANTARAKDRANMANNDSLGSIQ